MEQAPPLTVLQVLIMIERKLKQILIVKLVLQESIDLLEALHQQEIVMLDIIVRRVQK